MSLLDPHQTRSSIPTTIASPEGDDAYQPAQERAAHLSPAARFAGVRG